jgi:hypothetical protein
MSMTTTPSTTAAGSQTITSRKLEQGKWVHALPAEVLVSHQPHNDIDAAVIATQFNPARGTVMLHSATNSTHIADGVTDLAATPLPDAQ